MPRRLAFLFAAVSTLAFITQAPADTQPHAGMLRYPDVSQTQIVFVYANDLWLVPRTGGTALPLASPPGAEMFPKFSPDGAQIAFIGNYEGNRDLYVMPTAGGVSTRVTHHPDPETLTEWTLDGKQLIFYYNALAGLRRQNQLFTVPATGGMPEQLSVPYGTSGAISPDGQWLAYTPHTTDFRTWKRYRGGMATDIWLFNLRNHSSKRMTDWEGTDTLPMWHGTTVYYLCDAGPEHRLNIWSYDTVSAARKQLTTLKDFDAKWPSIGPGPDGKGEIVFQNGPDLCLLDLASAKITTVPVTIPGDRPRLRPQVTDVHKTLNGGSISNTGKRAILEMRGDLWSVPAEKGPARVLTQTSGIAERDPSWSPDGKHIAYFSDATGEYELYVMPTEGTAKPRQLTHDSKTFYYNPTWSPDSKMIACTDKAGRIFLTDVGAARTHEIDKDEWSNTPRVRWSSDSNWLTYGKVQPNQLGAIYLYDVKNSRARQVTNGMFNDTSPTFDRKGDFLYYTSQRAFTNPLYEDVGQSFVYAGTGVILAVPLRTDVASPFLPKSDEEEAASQPASKKSASSKTASSKAATKPSEKPFTIDLDGFEARAIQLPIKKGVFSNLGVTHDAKLLYVRGPRQGEETKPTIKIFDPFDDKDDKHEEKTVVAGTGGYDMSADGKKLLIFKGETLAIVSAAASQKLDKPIQYDDLTRSIDPRAEWKQVFTEAWRLQRDFFYDPNMHQIDWLATRKQYEKMLDDCASREDVGYVISEMLSELNVGHAYYRGFDSEDAPNVSVGLLGADLELANGAYRIKHILAGGAWDSDARSPLAEPGIKAKVGDYILAINRQPIDASKDFWTYTQGLAGKTVSLTLSTKPTLDDPSAPSPFKGEGRGEGASDKPGDAANDAPREILVELLKSEADLRYRDWVEHNRQYVADHTDKTVGYIYVPNTGTDGQNELFRQFYGQIDKAALIIDERWNGGGQIPTRFIELLNRPITNYWARRDGRDWPWPPDSHQGPKCMLINGLAGSGGDAFPAYFRKAGLGKLIGMRTWGGLVGISGNPGMIDGSSVTVPTFGFYKANSTWGIEGHGVDPDMEVIDDPAKMMNGADPQLDAAIKLMQAEIKTHGYTPPKRPAYPDRREMGVPEKDW